MSAEANIDTRRLLATSSLGRTVAQALPPDADRAEAVVLALATSAVIAAGMPGHEGETWSFEVRQPWTRLCCATHVDHAHAPDCAELPRCWHCGEAVHYERGVSNGSGTSSYVHDATGEYACADGFGHADTAPEPKATQERLPAGALEQQRLTPCEAEVSS